MAFKFENIKIWKLSLDLCNEIDILTKSFPKNESFSLSNQIKRAADSVNLNIAEGSIGQSNREFSRFLTYALRSAFEVVSCLYIAVARKYLTEQDFQKFYLQYEQLCKMITAFRKSLSSV